MSRPKGFKHSLEIREKMRRAAEGRKLSSEARRKISEAHKNIRGERHPNWNHDRVEQARKNKLSKMIYGLVGRSLRHVGKKKLSHGIELLGYTPRDLRTHLESLFEPGMTWENHGDGPDKWHVDHIKPVSEFGPDANVSEINALSNLRPLWERENLSRGGKQGSKLRWKRDQGKNSSN